MGAPVGGRGSTVGGSSRLYLVRMQARDLDGGAWGPWRAHVRLLFESLEAGGFKSPFDRGPVLTAVLRPITKLFDLRPQILRALLPWLLEAVEQANTPESVAIVALATVPRSWPEVRKMTAFYFGGRVSRREDEQEALQIVFERIERTEALGSRERQPFATARDLGASAPVSGRAWLKFVRASMSLDKIPRRRPELCLEEGLVACQPPLGRLVFDRERDTIDAIATRNGLHMAALELRRLFQCIFELQKLATPPGRDVVLRPPCPGVSPRCRRLAVLYEKASRPWRTTMEIAKIVQMPDGTVRSDIAAAKRRLFETLSSDTSKQLRQLLENLTSFRGFPTPAQIAGTGHAEQVNWWRYLTIAADSTAADREAPLTFRKGTLFAAVLAPERTFSYDGAVEVRGKHYHRLIASDNGKARVVDSDQLRRRYRSLAGAGVDT